MIKNMVILSLLTFLTVFISGCTGGKQLITVSNQYSVKPISYNAIFNLSTETWVKTEIFRKLPPLWSSFDDNDFNEMFKEVSQGVVPVHDPAAETKYTFNINLISTVFHRGAKPPLDDRNNTGVALQLTVLDNSGRTIDTKLFKIYGLWANEFGFVKGPVKLPLGTHPIEATLKFGLSDIINYICSGTFLDNTASDVIRISHVPPGYSFSIFSETVMDWDWESLDPNEVLKKAEETGEVPVNYYDKYGFSILYFQFIMAEDIDSFRPSPWTEDPGDYVETSALYGLIHRWPMFPEKLREKFKKLAQGVKFK